MSADAPAHLLPEDQVPFDLSSADPATLMLTGDKPRKVGIVGYTFSQRQAAWDDPEWLIVGMNNMHTIVQGATWGAWYDLHDRATIAADPEHEKWLRQLHPFPIWMMDPRPEFPSSRQFPRDELVARFGTYFTNTVSWQIAHAITLVEHAIGDGAEIGVWGVDMAQGTEYAAQRPSCEYFVGIATGMGIKVTIPEASDLLKTASIYGSTEGQAMLAKLRERNIELEERLGAVRSRRQQLQVEDLAARDAENQLVGALETQRYLTGTWFPPAVGPGSTRTANDLRATQGT